MRECKRLIKEFDREIKEEEGINSPMVSKQLNDEKQSMVFHGYVLYIGLLRSDHLFAIPPRPTFGWDILGSSGLVLLAKCPFGPSDDINHLNELQIKELNSYVAKRKTYQSTLGNKKVGLFEMGAGSSEPTADDNVQAASAMTNEELVQAGLKSMDETDQAIERSKQVVQQTVEVGTQTAVTLKGQTEQMGRIVNDLDAIHFSIKKASKLVKEIGRQVATDKCIMLFLFLIVCGVIAIIIVKIVHPENEDIRDIPGLAPPVPAARRLLYVRSAELF